MAEVTIGLGSNLGSHSQGGYQDRRAQLQQALDKIAEHPQITLIKVSRFFETTPVGPGDQPNYINAAAKIRTGLSAIELLDFLQSIECSQGRQRIQRWGPRTLDLDILTYDQLVCDTDRLVIPHPRLHERAFVLAPLADIDPQLQIPNQENVAQLLANCSSNGIVKIHT
ncbi:MAG: 2-amino-4-hydroxy-6-hydroxymethyldihydropteridine diphosphokinase [Porticoccaceae bacterium]